MKKTLHLLTDEEYQLLISKSKIVLENTVVVEVPDDDQVYATSMKLYDDIHKLEAYSKGMKDMRDLLTNTQ